MFFITSTRNKSIEKITVMNNKKKLCLLIQCGGDIHSVTHFWYTAWPDHKTPDASSPQLLRLIAEVHERRHDPISQAVIGPVVVHCRYERSLDWLDLQIFILYQFFVLSK